MSSGDIAKIIGSAFLALFIVFASFLWYIVFNPTRAQFFVSLGINPADISRLLSTLVGVIFGAITFVLSIVWIVFLFRAIRMRKEFRKQKIISGIVATLVGILLFTNITVWAYLVKIVHASDYENPDGAIIVYDNAKLLSSKYVQGPNTNITAFQMRNTTNLIGPIVLRFNLDAQARKVAKQMNITGYHIDFDGDGASDRDGEDPTGDQAIIYSFDKKRSYIPKLTFVGTDKATKEESKINVDLPEIKIIGLVDVKQLKQRTGGIRLQFDATDLQRLGQIEWYTENMNKPESTDYKFMPAKTYKDEAYVCLVVFTNINTKKNCAREYYIQTAQDNAITGDITATPDDVDPMTYHFGLDHLVSKHGIASSRWNIDGKTDVGSGDTVDYTFTNFGKASIAVTVADYLGNTSILKSTLLVQKPLKLAVSDKVISGLVVRSRNTRLPVVRTYNKYSNATMITDFPVPDTLELDARNVQVTDATFRLTNVSWDMTGSGKFTKSGQQATLELIDQRRYVFAARYEFTSINDPKDVRTIDERIILDAQQKDIIPSFTLKQDSDYVPTYVVVDASASSTKEGHIVKFLFDFGEGSGKTIEGDAVQKYKYTLPGEYTITVTAVRDDTRKESLSRKLILKEPSKKLVINTSVSSGYTGKSIDFDAVGSVGQITDYRWKFGNGEVSSEPSPTYTYQQAGTYTVKLVATFADGTVRTVERTIEVVDM